MEGNFTVADFMTCYLNLAIFAGKYFPMFILQPSAFIRFVTTGSFLRTIISLVGRKIADTALK